MTLGLLGHPEEAADCYRRANALKPSGLHSYHLGIVLSELEDFEGAEEAFRQAVSFEPTLIENRWRLADVLVDRGKPEEAIRLLEDEPTASAPYVTALVVLARAYQETSRADDALRVARMAAALKPEHAMARATLGSALLGVRQPVEALDEFRRAREQEPEEVEYCVGEGMALSSLGRHQEALAAFAAVLTRAPDYMERNPMVADSWNTSRRAIPSESANASPTTDSP